MQSETLKIAIQKSGRLSEKSADLLRECGIDLPKGKDKLCASALNFPLEVLFLRDDDIPQYVARGVADIGIVGENVVLEKTTHSMIIDHLGFARCKLSLAIRRDENYPGISHFQNKTIATSYPNILQSFFDSRQIKADIEEISGSVEIAPGIGLADGICDLVSSGGTLLANGLKEVEVVMNSEAVLIARDEMSDEKRQILDRLQFRFQAKKNARRYKYILLNAPNDNLEKIISILPGMKSPSLLPLAESGWTSVHSVICEDDFWQVIDQLKTVGAEGILVSPIEKMIL